MNTLKLVGGSLVALLGGVVARDRRRLTPAQKCQDAIAVGGTEVLRLGVQGAGQVPRRRAVTGTPADCSPTHGHRGDRQGRDEADHQGHRSAPGRWSPAPISDSPARARRRSPTWSTASRTTSTARAPLELIDARYDGLGADRRPLLRKCQKTIGKAVRKGAKLRQKARRKCAKPIALVENPPTPCPDAKAFDAFDKAREKLIILVEKKCNDTQVLDAALKFGGECGDDPRRRAGGGVPVHDVRRAA